MSPDLLLAMAVFSVTTTIQPGPNNALLMASGLNFGFVRTLPAILGLCLGFTLMMLAVGFGLAQLFAFYPLAHTILKLASVVFLLYLAWRIANATPRTGDVGAKPMSLGEGFGIIVLNPQGWVFATSFVTAFLQPGNVVASVLILTGVCVLARFFGASVWAFFGSALRSVLTNTRAVRAFNITMALLMVASLWPIVRDLAWELKR